MKTKEDVLKESYGEYWKHFKDLVSYDGWTAKSLIPFMNVSDIEFVNKLQRPKSLKGIENNNGWIKYNGKGIGYLDIVHTDLGNTYPYAVYICYSSIYEMQKITHYQKIEIPKPPIF